MMILTLISGSSAQAQSEKAARSSVAAPADHSLVTKARPAFAVKTEPKDCGATAGGGPVIYEPALDMSESVPASKKAS
jgi:hypothetical protein